MRKDVKRSLVLWPLTASLVMVAVSWHGTMNQGWFESLGPSADDQQRPSWDSQVVTFQSPANIQGRSSVNATAVERTRETRLESTFEVLHPQIAPTPAEVAAIERPEYGVRGMRMPLRLERELASTEKHDAPSDLLTEARNPQYGESNIAKAAPRESDNELVIDLDHMDLESVASDEYRLNPSTVKAQASTEADIKVALPSEKPGRLIAPIRDEHQELAGHHSAIAASLSDSLDAPSSVDGVADYSPLPEIQSPLNTIAAVQPEAVQAELGERRASDRKRASVLPESIAVLAKISPRPTVNPKASSVASEMIPDVSSAADAGESFDAASVFESTRRSHQLSPAGWPVTNSLNRQLDRLDEFVNSYRAEPSTQSNSQLQELAELSSWSERVQQTLAELRTEPRLGGARAGTLIERLDTLRRQGQDTAEAMVTRETQMHFLYACYAIERRVAVWQPIWQLSQTGDTQMLAPRNHVATEADASEFVAQVRAILSETGDAEGWNRFLLLDPLESAATGASREDRAMLAKRFLARLRWHGLHPDHREWLRGDKIEQLAIAIRPWTRGAVDYASLLNQLEHQESNEIDTVSLEIAEAVQTLRHSDNPIAVKVASAIDTHYRNANIRLAISQSMLQRMLPTIAPQSVPIRTQVLGSQVRGISHVKSNLSIALLPSPNHWQIDLRTLGNVKTRSIGHSGPVALRTAGDSDFLASTPIEITPDGVQLGGSWVDVNGRNQLQGIETDYDSWPLIGTLVRSLATTRYESLEPLSNQISIEKVRSQVGGEIDQRVDKQINDSARSLSKLVLGPLGALKLDPQVADMQTTNDRLLARYRLAGDWQLGAFTPRPRALRNSLMSVQVHQSSMNNTLEQLVPRDQPRRIVDMIQEGMVLFGQQASAIPEDIPDDVMIQFAKTRPITVEIENGKLWLTLRVVKLTRGEMLDLRRFIVRASYVPQVDGLKATLVRDGHLSISGPNLSMRERLPIRAIFTKVLSPNRGLPLTSDVLAMHPASESLAISQLELREGWIALSLSELDQARIATRPDAR